MSDILGTLRHIETRSHSQIWSSYSLLYKGTMIAANYTQDLVERCQGKVIHVLVPKGAKWSVEQEPIDWKRLGKLMSDQLTGKNSLETAFQAILKKKYPDDFVPKRPS